VNISSEGKNIILKKGKYIGESYVTSKRLVRPHTTNTEGP